VNFVVVMYLAQKEKWPTFCLSVVKVCLGHNWVVVKRQGAVLCDPH